MSRLSFHFRSTRMAFVVPRSASVRHERRWRNSSLRRLGFRRRNLCYPRVGQSQTRKAEGLAAASKLSAGAFNAVDEKSQPSESFVNPAAQVVCTSEGSIYSIAPWPDSKRYVVWKRLGDISASAGTPSLAVRFEGGCHQCLLAFVLMFRFRNNYRNNGLKYGLVIFYRGLSSYLTYSLHGTHGLVANTKGELQTALFAKAVAIATS
jgi:hypothetical protein